MEGMIIARKKNLRSGNNKKSPLPQHPQNHLAAVVGLGFLPVDGDGTGVAVALPTVVVATAVEEFSPAKMAYLWLLQQIKDSHHGAGTLQRTQITAPGLGFHAIQGLRSSPSTSLVVVDKVMKALRTLLLFSNMLDGVIPNELGQLHKLEILDVSRNNLNGFIPAELGDCVQLSVLALSNLFDPVPRGQSSNKELSSTLSLTAMTYEYNHFQGSVPMEITTLPKLKILWVPGASLEGKLPSNWSGCENLEMLNLAQNNFSGDVFGVFNGCKKLRHLDLSLNRLNGELDEKLPVPCMTLFDISGNLMSGSIPRFNHSVCPSVFSSYELPRNNDPASAYLSFFTYETHRGMLFPFSSFKAVSVHNFGGNNFSGSLPWLPIAPTRLDKHTDYAFLAGGNMLTGSFPGSLFGNCNKLHGMIVDVSKNRLSGHIPSEIGAICGSLRFLDVSENQLTGVIPQSVRELKSLVFLDLSGNRLRGPIPEGLHQLTHLKHLSLASNNLTGAIPSSFGRFVSLEVLELSSNSLSGEIPGDLVNLRNLTCLRLNNNKLSGKLPSGLSNKKCLPTLDVSFNNLSRSFPLNGNAVNSITVRGKPFLHSHHVFSLSVRTGDTTTSTGDSQDGTDPPSASSNATVDKSLDSIEIASIASASAIVSVLLVLVVLFFYTRKWVPTSRIQVAEPKEITAFVDIGVPVTYETIVQATGNFSAGKCIGNGGFGATYKAEIAPGTLVAVKRLAVGRFQGVQQFHAEAVI
ncbi:hypothetical protein CCACVL1_06477 [Corchorus capsularis]|uniref:Protein kinase domain-containing protein n=1 Tax=Corchorus capsularis TaxID=210143 RepID=A0A1R3JFE0_COCAP|nr:hypothetical protein CCACVL1_06477 [Corchorus capsularis]